MTTGQPATNACTDAPPGSDWTCRDGDGTGLWCDACKGATGATVKALQAEVEELCADLRIARHDAKFFSGLALETRDRAEAAEATLAKVREAVEQVEALAKVQAMSCQAQHRADHARNWLDVLAILERAVLDGAR